MAINKFEKENKRRRIPPEPGAKGLFWISGATWPRFKIVLAAYTNSLDWELSIVKQEKNGWRKKETKWKIYNVEFRGSGDGKNGGEDRILTGRMY